MLLVLLCTGWADQGNRLLTVEEIRFQGLKKTQESVLLEYMSFRKGSQIDRQELFRNELRLQDTNFFNNVQLLAIPGSQPGYAIIRVTVEERYFPSFQFRSGYNELDGWYVSPLGIRLDNLLGFGNQFGAHVLVGDRIAGLEIDYGRPFFLGTEFTLQFKINAYERDFVHFLGESRYKQKVNEGNLTIRLRSEQGITRFFTGDLVLETVTSDSFLITPNGADSLDAPPELASVNGKRQVNRIVLAAKLDTRDNPVHPLSGWWGGIVYDQAARGLGSFVNYYRLSADIRRYQPIWKQLIFAFRLRYARTSDITPFYKKFYLGGTNSLRGYKDRSLTPQGYAEKVSQGNFEIRFPLSTRLKDKSRFTGVFFYDVGYAWNGDDRWQFKALKAGVGAGLRIKLPLLGLLRLDVAYAVSDYETLRTHIALGHTF